MFLYPREQQDTKDSLIELIEIVLQIRKIMKQYSDWLLQSPQAHNSSFWCVFESAPSGGRPFIRGVWDRLCIYTNVRENHRSSKIV